VNLYLESSAALRDILEGAGAPAIRALIASAEHVAASQLTLAEVRRVLARLRVLDPLAAARVAPREAEFESDTELWVLLPIDGEVLARCGRPFPVEPVRMLHAVHLATVERLGGALPALTVLSIDQRVRSNATALGFAVAP
jgi:predicted nucleic acid-binding protein